jgi:hypothetical protein
MSKFTAAPEAKKEPAPVQAPTRTLGEQFSGSPQRTTADKTREEMLEEAAEKLKALQAARSKKT